MTTTRTYFLLCDDDVKAFRDEFIEIANNMGEHTRLSDDTDENRELNARRAQLEEWLLDALEYCVDLYLRTREIPPQRRILSGIAHKYMYHEYMAMVSRVVENP